MNLSKVREEDNSYYVLNTGSISKWEKRLENYMEDALVMLRPVQHRYFENFTRFSPLFGSVIDSLDFPDVIATLFGDDVYMIICERCYKSANLFWKA